MQLVQIPHMPHYRWHFLFWPFRRSTRNLHSAYYLPVDPCSPPSRVHCPSCLSDEKELSVGARHGVNTLTMYSWWRRWVLPPCPD